MDWAAAIERETARLRDAATDPAAAVPTCPGWDVAELVRHVGTAHRNAAMIVRDRLATHPSPEQVQPPAGVDPFAWLAEGTAALLDVVRTTDPATPVWTFGPDRTAGFWFRRMAQETMVHRVDAERAAGRPSELDRELADDGVAESLEVFLPLLARNDTGPPTGELLLHALDGRSWVITFGADAVDVVEDHRKGDACVQGPVADLLLWLWGRVPTEALTLDGDPALAARLQRVTRA